MIALLLALLGTMDVFPQFALTPNPSPRGRGEKIWLPSPAGRGVGGEGSAGADILFPAGGKTVRLRLAVTIDEQSPDVAWEAFLDKLFDYFDRDGDGLLSATEAGRIFPLPLPGDRDAKMDFARLDSDRDGEREAGPNFGAYYRADWVYACGGCHSPHSRGKTQFQVDRTPPTRQRTVPTPRPRW